jgi:membrane fusion protein
MNVPAPPFLETEPPHWAARGLSYFLILLSTVVLLVAVLLRLPETVAAPFVLSPVQGTDPVRALRSGRVADVLVVEGQSVAKGSTLFAIQSQEVGDRFSERQTLENQIEGAEDSLANARLKQENDRRGDLEEARRLAARRANLDRMLGMKREQLAVANEQLRRANELAKEGLTSWIESSNYTLKASEAALELQQLDAERRDVEAEVEKRRSESQSREAQFREIERSLKEGEEKARIRLRALAADSATGGGSGLVVTAPCSGVVLRLQAKRTGAVVGEGDVLCELACAGERLRAELTVPQSGLALIQPGQTVKLLYDAFPYQRYGVHHGVVRWTSPAGVTVADAPSFRVFVDLAEDGVRVNGERRPLMSGMGGTARVVVGRRSLISYAFEPLRQLRENLAVPPAGGGVPGGGR